MKMKNFEEIIARSLERSINSINPNIRDSILNDCSNVTIVEEKRKKKIITKIGYGIAISYMAFFLIINTIPVSAQMLYKIPIIDKLVWGSLIDKGIFQALDKGYSQPINELTTDKGIIFTVHDLILGNKINFLMSIKPDIEIYESEIKSINISVTDQDGEGLSFSSHSPYYDKDSKSYIFDCSVMTFKEGTLKDVKSINLEISSITFEDNSKLEGDWQIRVPMQADYATEQVLWEKEINEKVVKENGSSFIIEKLVSTYSDIAIYVNIDAQISLEAPRGRNIYMIDSEGLKIPMAQGTGQKNGDIMQYKYYFDTTHPNEPVRIVFIDGEDVKEIELE